MIRAIVMSLALSGASVLSSAPGPLTLEGVLESVDAHHPKLDSEARLRDAAEAKQQGARGNWDPKLSVYGKWVPLGYYRTGQVDTVVRQSTPLWGVGVFAGYRLGQGDFAVYKGEYETGNLGELRAGLDVPIFRDGPIDEGRADIQRSEHLLDAAECSVAATRLGLRRDAATAYWKWAAAGRKVDIQGTLLATAEARDLAIRERVRQGSAPDILVVDNERLILDRRAKLIAARRSFNERAVDLSLYLRDEDKTPVVAPEGQLPPLSSQLERPVLPPESYDLSRAIVTRPELCEILGERSAAEVDLRLAKNRVAPELRVSGYVARDLGDTPTELAPTELVTGVTLSMPLALRKARGELRAARAKLASVDAKLRGLQDKIGAQVRRARVDLIAAFEQLQIATRQAQVARQLADAEREKLDEGASDLVILNIRELAAADAENLEVEAILRYRIAEADYRQALGDLG